MRPGFLRAFIAGALISICAAARAGDSPPDISVAPPPGFEDLSGAEDLVVDVWFLGRYVGSARALHGVQTLEFVEPAVVVALLGPILEPARLLQALSRPLDSHEGLQCRSPAAPPCAQLRADPVAVVYSAQDFRATILVDPALLLDLSASVPRFLPASSAGWSVVQRLSGVAAGSFGGEPGYNLRPSTQVAWRNARLTADFALASDSQPLAESLELGLDHKAWRYRGGLYAGTGDPLLPGQRMIGLAAGTQTDTRLDQASLAGSPLSLFLPAPAQVELYRDGRLLDARMYEAGHQVLDASTLPDGAYELNLRIRDLASGAVREEPAFFSKHLMLAPFDQDLVQFEVGVTRPHAGTRAASARAQATAMASYRHRLAASTGLGLALRSLGGDTLGEVSLQYLGPALRGQLTAGANQRGATGVAANLTAQSAHFSFSADVRHFDSGPLAGDSTPINQLRGDLQYLCCRGLRLGARARRTQTDFDTQTEWGPYAVLPLHRGADGALDLRIEHQWRDSDRLTLLQLQWHRRGRRWEVDTQADYNARSADATSAGDEELGARVAANWLAFNREESQLALGGALSGSETQYRAAVGSRYQGAEGRANLELDRSQSGERSSSTYDLGFSLAAAGTPDAFYWGGSSLGDGAIVVALDGRARPEGRFQVLVDGRPRMTLAAGERKVLYLTAYRTYSVRLEALSGPQLNYDSTPRRVVLYPGNVQSLHWPVSRMLTVYGRALAVPGRALAHAVVLNALEGGSTDRDGYFQAEVLEHERLLKLRRADGSECLIDLPPATVEDYVGLGERECLALPRPRRMSPRLSNARS